MRMLANEETSRACGGSALPPGLGERYSPGTVPPTQVGPGGGTGYLHDRSKAMQARLDQARVAG